jgi:hypothetical protein
MQTTAILFAANLFIIAFVYYLRHIQPELAVFLVLAACLFLNGVIMYFTSLKTKAALYSRQRLVMNHPIGMTELFDTTATPLFPDKKELKETAVNA